MAEPHTLSNLGGVPSNLKMASTVAAAASVLQADPPPLHLSQLHATVRSRRLQCERSRPKDGNRVLDVFLASSKMSCTTKRAKTTPLGERQMVCETNYSGSPGAYRLGHRVARGHRDCISRAASKCVTSLSGRLDARTFSSGRAPPKGKSGGSASSPDLLGMPNRGGVLKLPPDV